MKNRDTNIIEIFDKKMYISNSKRGWAVVVMPDEIRIDNYHGHCHIHMELNGIHIPIKYRELEEIKFLIRCHISKNQGINKELLQIELIGDYND
jgi:hypothetical protein